MFVPKRRIKKCRLHIAFVRSELYKDLPQEILKLLNYKYIKNNFKSLYYLYIHFIYKKCKYVRHKTDVELNMSNCKLTAIINSVSKNFENALKTEY